MKREEYRSLLGRTFISSPTAEDMARACPHLTAEQAVQTLLTQGSLAMPPLLVRDTYQVLEFLPQHLSYEGKNVPSLLTISRHPVRLPQPGKAAQKQYEFAEEAVRFAEENWGASLIHDEWVDVRTIYVEDPTDLVNNLRLKDTPRTKFALTVGLRSSWNYLINNRDHPLNEVLDRSFSYITSDPFESFEMRVGRGLGSGYSCCAHCGAGLTCSDCSGCKHKFYDDGIRTGWCTPLSRRMVAFLCEKGHVFQIDPEIAQQKERQKWEGWQAEAMARLCKTVPQGVPAEYSEAPLKNIGSIGMDNDTGLISVREKNKDCVLSVATQTTDGRVQGSVFCGSGESEVKPDWFLLPGDVVGFKAEKGANRDLFIVLYYTNPGENKATGYRSSLVKNQTMNDPAAHRHIVGVFLEGYGYPNVIGMAKEWVAKANQTYSQ